MGKIVKKSALGTIKGKVGRLVVNKWRKIDVVKSAPGKRIKERITPLPDQSLRLSLVSHFLSRFKSDIRIGFYKKNNRIPPFQAAVQYNLQHAVAGESPDFKIDYSKVVLSKGNLEMVWSEAIFLDENKMLHISWEIPSTSKLKVVGMDTTHIIIYSHTLEKDLNAPDTVRQDLYAARDLKFFSGHTIYIWLFFTSTDHAAVSNSQYLGTVTVPK